MVRRTPKRGVGGSNPLWDAKNSAGIPSKIKGFRRNFILYKLYAYGILFCIAHIGADIKDLSYATSGTVAEMLIVRTLPRITTVGCSENSEPVFIALKSSKQSANMGDHANGRKIRSLWTICEKHSAMKTYVLHTSVLNELQILI